MNTLKRIARGTLILCAFSAIFLGAYFIAACLTNDVAPVWLRGALGVIFAAAVWLFGDIGNNAEVMPSDAKDEA